MSDERIKEYLSSVPSVVVNYGALSLKLSIFALKKRECHRRNPASDAKDHRRTAWLVQRKPARLKQIIPTGGYGPKTCQSGYNTVLPSRMSRTGAVVSFVDTLASVASNRGFEWEADMLNTKFDSAFACFVFEPTDAPFNLALNRLA